MVFSLVSVEDDVTLSLVKEGDEFWTGKLSQELFNFTVTNGNPNYNFSEINITIPDEFTFSGSMNDSLSSWDCNDNTDLVTCQNKTEDLLTNGESINIWFNTDSMDLDNEAEVIWFVDFNENLDINITTGIDGKPPEVNEINMSYMGSELENGDNVTERENIILTVDIQDTGIGVDKVWVNVTNYSDNVFSTINLEGDSIFSGEIATESLVEGDYTIKIFSNDSFGNLNNTEEVNFIANPLPDFEVGSFSWDPLNPYPGQDLVVYSNLKVTNPDASNVSVVWSGNSECNEVINFTQEGEYEVNCTFTSFSGENNVSLEVDPGNSISETSENNNYHSQIFSTNLNFNILNVLYEDISYNDSELVFLSYNETLTLNVSVKYWNNGDPVDNIGLTNFEIDDKWVSGSTGYRNRTDRLTDIDDSMSNSGLYLINYTTPNISGQNLEYGEHNLKFKVNKDNYSGESDDWEYFLDGPDLVITFTGLESSLDLDGETVVEDSFDIVITNEGNYTINDVQIISIETNSDASLPESDDIEACKNKNENLGPDDSLVCEGMKIRVTDSGARLTVVTHGTYENNLLEYEQYSHSISVTDSGDDGNDGDDGVQEDEDEDEDWEDQSQKSGGFLATSKSVKTKEYLEINTAPEKIELEQGKRITKSIEVENIDDIEFQQVKLQVKGINSSWITVLPSGEVEIEPLMSKQYRVVFEVPDDVEIKDYEGEFEASSSFKTKKKSFTLTVFPGEELQTTIDQTIQDYQNQIEQLEKEIEEKESKGYNVTEAETKLQVLKEEFNKLISYRDGGNYKSAYDLMDDTENLIEETTNVLSGAVVLSSRGLLTLINFSWLAPGLFGLLFVVGGYTWWGRRFKLQDKFLEIVRKVKGKIARTGSTEREKELDILASNIKKGESKPTRSRKRSRTEKAPKEEIEISGRVQELNVIKNLVKGK
jgi:hypothetical protein